uniref:Secreted protein n=1 Tax=Caenorhabditis tropicalis TaxID=1561998 RepID=A0A1I7V2U5_9PELO
MFAMAYQSDHDQTDELFPKAVSKLHAECMQAKRSEEHCNIILGNGAATACANFCKQDPRPQKYCKTLNKDLVGLKPTTRSPCPTRPTTTEHVTQAPFPAATLIGGLLLGVLIGIVLTQLVACICMKKPHDRSDGHGKKKKKKGKKSKNTSTGKTGTGTNTGGSSNSTEGRKKKTRSSTSTEGKKKKSKEKKGKKGKKGKKSMTKTGSGF